MREIAESAGVANRLPVLEVPDHTCLVRLRARNAAGDHPFAVTEAQSARLLKHFVPPTQDEGFTLMYHRP